MTHRHIHGSYLVSFLLMAVAVFMGEIEQPVKALLLILVGGVWFKTTAYIHHEIKHKRKDND